MEMLESSVSSHFSVIYQVALSYHYVPFYPLTFFWKAILLTTKAGSEQPGEQPSPGVWWEWVCRYKPAPQQ